MLGGPVRRDKFSLTRKTCPSVQANSANFSLSSCPMLKSWQTSFSTSATSGNLLVCTLQQGKFANDLRAHPATRWLTKTLCTTRSVNAWSQAAILTGYDRFLRMERHWRGFVYTRALYKESHGNWPVGAMLFPNRSLAV